MTKFTDVFESQNFNDIKGDNDLKDNYYNAGDNIYALESYLEDNYKDMSKDFEKIIKTWEAFSSKYKLGKL